MAFPDAVAIKYDAFTLCCRKLLEHLQVLNEAVHGDTRVTSEGCISLFDESMQQFFKRSTASSPVEAVEDLSGLIRGQAGLIRRQNSAAAEVFNRVVVTIAEAAPTWHYQDDLEAHHRQGQEFARRFYAKSSWPVTLERLNREARLVYEYDLPDLEDLSAIGMEPFGYRAAPLAYRASYPEDSGETMRDVIIVRFLFDHNFALYLAYPYLFLHEYTAHIYATDYGNDRFNDGWMLYAAHKFLREVWFSPEFLASLQREQANALFPGLYPRLRYGPRRDYDLAWDIAELVSDWGRFMAMTYELAAFTPRRGEGPFWPTQFINALEREFKANPHRLRQKIEAAHDLRMLWSMLAHS
ncbi:MAG: hypothetical protein FJZ89_09610 [Chloroflexi bacterium]|nr:hypothetical protein [Chloroflexota bacterium]